MTYALIVLGVLAVVWWVWFWVQPPRQQVKWPSDAALSFVDNN